MGLLYLLPLPTMQDTLPDCNHTYAGDTLQDVTKIMEVIFQYVGRVAQSIQRLATGWMIRRSNPGRREIFRTCPDWPWGPLCLLYNGYRVFPVGKEQPGRDTDPSPPSSAVVMKE
jgi:hypothetical protein